MSGYGTMKIVKDSVFFKVEEGKPHTVRLLDENPVEEFTHNINQKMIRCDGDSCVYCDDGNARKQRFVTNVYDHTDSRVYLWSYGSGVAGVLKNIAQSLAKDGEDILNHDLEVSAAGTGMQKKTTVQVRIKSIPPPSGIKKHRIGPKEEATF